MRATLAKDLAEKDARARDNKRLFQGTVLAVNTATHTVRVKVLQDGPVQVLEDVTYTAQTPPQIGDVGDLIYASSSNHSVRFANPRLGGGNSSSTIIINASNVVNSIKKTGESSSNKQSGDLELEAVSPLVLTRTGKKFSFSGGGFPSASQIGTFVGCIDGTSFQELLPVTSDDGWLIDDNGYMVVEAV